MSDSTTNLDLLDQSQAQKEVTANALFNTASPAMIYGRRDATTTGLTWGYYGGRWGGMLIANGTVTLASTATNYVVANLVTGVVSTSTSDTNWNATGDYGRLFLVTTLASAVLEFEDHRAGPGGVYAAAGASGTAGKHCIPIAGPSFRPSVTDGCSLPQSIAGGSNQPDIIFIAFDATTQQYGQLIVPMPPSWDRGNLTVKFHWSHPSTTTSFGVVFSAECILLDNGDPFATTYGSAVTVTDTGGLTDTMYTTSESGGFSSGVSVGDLLCLRISRVAGNGSDTLAVDARLHGVSLFFTTDAETDA